MPVRPLVAVLALTFAACASHAPPPPAEPMPLPPASGSPIGYLVDDAVHLGLTDAQLAKLREIDATLAAHLEELDATERAGHAAPPGQAPSGHIGRRGGMHMRGGAGGGPSGGGPSGGPGGGGHGGPRGGGHSGPGGGHHGPGGGPGGAAITEERTLYVRDALARAFGILDAPQRAKAKQYLVDRGVDLDIAPRPRAEPGEGERGDDAAIPVEP